MKANTEQEWWDMVRADLRKWNQSAHEDDVLTLIDWVGELSGPQPTYGYFIVRDDSCDSGYCLIKEPCKHENTFVSIRHTSGIELVKCKDCGASL